MNTTKPRKPAARKAAPTPMTTTGELDARLAALAARPGTTETFLVDLAATTLNAVRVRILRTTRRHGWSANRIRLAATDGTVVTLEVTNTGQEATPLPATAGGPKPAPKAAKARARKVAR